MIPPYHHEQTLHAILLRLHCTPDLIGKVAARLPSFLNTSLFTQPIDDAWPNFNPEIVRAFTHPVQANYVIVSSDIPHPPNLT